MDASEFDRLTKHLFVAFPDVWEWLNANSPDVNATLDVWHKTLSGYQLAECLHVLDDWITGKRPLFKAYERAQIAILIRQCVQFDRDRDSQRNKTQAESDVYQRGKRGEYKPLAADFPLLGQIFRAGMELRTRFLKGEITEEHMVAERRRLIDSIK